MSSIRSLSIRSKCMVKDEEKKRESKRDRKKKKENREGIRDRKMKKEKERVK
jgi:hypothetical protein